MKKIILTAFFILVGFCSLFFVVQASTLSDQAMLQVNVAASENAAGLGNARNPQEIAVDIINILLGIVGVVFTGLIFYGGFVYLTAQGEEEKAKKGAGIIKASIIGLLVVLASYAIVLFVSGAISEANVATEDYYL